MCGSSTKTEATTLATRPGSLDVELPGMLPGLVLAWSPPELLTDDRLALLERVTIGRSSSCSWCIRDSRLSRRHFAIEPKDDGRFIVFDLGSRNGVIVDGERVSETLEIEEGAVIRAGGCLFVLVRDLATLRPPDAPQPTTDYAGRYTAWGLVRQLRVAARSRQPVLLHGESGVGKELAARAFHEAQVELTGCGGMRALNAAVFADEGDAVGSLFGVARGAFTGVAPRPGVLELAEGGTVFIDEVHALPLRVQRSLLRFVEDGLVQPLGQPSPRAGKRVDIHLIFGTNMDIERACVEHQLAHDLVARLYRVELTPLRERRADIPSIFLTVLRRTLSSLVVDDVIAALRMSTIERICCHDYRAGNARELVKLSSIIGARIAEGERASAAIGGALSDVFAVPKSPRVSASDSSSSAPSAVHESHYEQHREEILAVYREVGGNLSRMEARLRESGLSCTRRWLSIYLDRWGVRPIPRRG